MWPVALGADMRKVLRCPRGQNLKKIGKKGEKSLARLAAGAKARLVHALLLFSQPGPVPADLFIVYHTHVFCQEGKS